MSERMRLVLQLVSVGLAAGLEAVAAELRRQQLTDAPRPQGDVARPGYTPPDF